MSGNRNVRFDEGPSPGGRSTSSRQRSDSGIGSSSSEQANTGRRPDRRFTEQDREHQRGNVRALQEALESAKDHIDKYKKKCVDYEQRLSNANKTSKEAEARWRAECDRNETLQEEIKALKQQVREFKLDIDQLRDERDDWHQHYLAAAQPVDETFMRGGSGEPSDGVKRSKSKRDSGSNQTERLKERMNRPNKEAESSSRTHRQRPSHGRRASISVMPGSTTSSHRPPYIEEPPRDDASRPPLTDYTYVYTDERPTRASMYSGTPRSVRPSVTVPSAFSSSSHHTAEGMSGDYVRAPLPRKLSTRHHERGGQ